MKKLINLILVIAVVALFTGCSDSKRVKTEKVGEHVFTPYGLFNEREKKNPNVEYEIVIGNVVWSVILVETIIVPIILVGWYIYEPVGPKVEDNNMRGISK